MSGLVPVPSPSQSLSSATSIDPYDQAEQGSHVSSTYVPGTQRPLEAKRTLSLRYSLRSTDRTLTGVSGGAIELDSQREGRIPLPRQEPSSRSAKWFARCMQGIQHLSFLWSGFHRSPAEPPDDYKACYTQLQYKRYEDYPDGWPRLAAFMESSDSFGIYRQFGHCHARLLVTHMSNITELETDLDKLDRADEAGGKDTNWRLKNRYHEEGLDTTKRDLQDKLEKELLAYDTLLQNFRAIKSMSRTPARHHGSVLRWLWAKKPLDDYEADWIKHPEDFISLMPPRQNRFETFILRQLDEWPSSYLKIFFQTEKQQHQSQDPEVKFYCPVRISTVARLISVFFAVLVLFIPVILFFLTSMTRTWMAMVVLAFCFVFSVMISLFTDAGDKEIFIGTATYCAVLVTFLGNLQGPK